jgi:hypothetical protein
VLKQIFIFTIICGLAFAQSTLDYDKSNNSLNLKITIPRVDSNTTTEAEYQEFLTHNSVLVIGSEVDFSERLLLEGAKTQQSFIGKLREVKDSSFDIEKIRTGQIKLAILIGGPLQNSITNISEKENWFNNSQEVGFGILLKSGKLDNGVVVLSLSSKKGYDQELKRQSVNYSPLAAVIPKEYVPVAATGISLVIMAIINLTRTVFEFKALELGRKNQKVGQGAKFIGLVNLNEVIAIVGASFILGLSISWQYFGPSADFAKWIIINTIICLVGAILHEVTHKIFAHFFKIKLEYRFWPAGSVLTLISSYLGNAFSIQAFILEEIPEKIPKWKVGLMKLAAPVVSAIVMVTFAVINLNTPSPIYQAIYTTSALWAMAEMLPFSSLDGKDIKEWNSGIWATTFLLIGAAYFFVTFII